MGEFAKHYRVILGMNENECKIVYEALYPDFIYDNYIHAGQMIFEKAGIDVLVVHPRDCAIAWDSEGRYKEDNFFIKAPKISTGGGDNFNAGLCLGQLLGMDIVSSLVVANAVAAFYVKMVIALIGELVDFLTVQTAF